MGFFSNIFGTNYESETGYTELEEAIKEIVKEEIEREIEEEKQHIKEILDIVDGEYKGNNVVDIGKGSVKVYK